MKPDNPKDNHGEGEEGKKKRIVGTRRPAEDGFFSVKKRGILGS